jgi:Ser/Thr protein kinase RdoA (MazF antagonist)
MSPVRHNRAVATADQIRSALRSTWHRAADECVALPAGLDVADWAVRSGGQRWVARVVAGTRRSSFEAGLAVAEYLASVDLPAATPVRAVDGSTTSAVGTEVVALVRHLPGRTLDGTDPVDQQWWGDALATAHRSLAGFRHSGLAKFHPLRADAAHLDVDDWVRPAVAAAVAAVRKLTITDQLTYGVLHGDPAPGAFRLDPQTGRLGLVDWGPAGTGPLMYDVAAAVGYAGGGSRDLVEAYLAAGPVPREEVEAALPTMLLFRWAVRADHHARRLAAADRPADRDGLAAAREALVGLVG